MSDEPSDMIAALRRQHSTVITTQGDRRDRELQSVHHLDRRGMRTPPEHVRNVQLNLKISRRFKSRLEGFAVARKLSVTELIVRAVEAYAAKE